MCLFSVFLSGVAFFAIVWYNLSIVKNDLSDASERVVGGDGESKYEVYHGKEKISKYVCICILD